MVGITPAAEVPGVQQDVPSGQRIYARVSVGDADKASPVLSRVCGWRGGVVLHVESRRRFGGGRFHESSTDAYGINCKTLGAVR